jgi:regulator of sigma D
MKIFFFLTIISFPEIFSTVQNNSLIDWSADRKLSWDDFKQRPDPSSPNAALTSSIIKYDFGYNNVDGLKFHIHCQFDKEKSWGRSKTDYILSHEQGHFDIAEIFARKLNKAFKEYTPASNIKKDINKIYSDLMHQLQAMQAQYDKETNFSINKPQQEEWLKKIKDQLKELEAYANYSN